jgi:CRP-like cAMP-binding protein
MKKILLIEDDLVMRENTEELLELAGFSVESSENGVLGVIKAKEFLPDIIISDIMMPELDGYGVLHMLSNDPLTNTIPFIFLSAKAEKSEVRKGMELGADDYLTKPFEESELLKAIEVRLKKFNENKLAFSKGFEGLVSSAYPEETESLLKKLTESKKTFNFKKKEVVYHEQDTALQLYYLESGKVKTFRSHDDGKEYITSVYSDGDFFGVKALFEDSAYTESAITLEESKVKKIPKEDFLDLVYKNRDISTQFIKMLSKNIEENEKKLISLAYDTVRKRTAQVLVELGDKHSAEKKGPVEIKMTREDLASLAGTAIETVIRCLRDLKNENLIEIKGRSINLLNIGALKEIK